MNIFKTQAILSSIRSRKDRTYTICFDTQELDPLSVGELSQMLQHFVTIGVASKEEQIDELDHLEVPDEVLEVGQKSFGERARAVAFLRWKNKGQKEPFDIYWSRLKEQMIDALKKGLPPRD